MVSKMIQLEHEKGIAMANLDRIIEKAKEYQMSAQEKEQQRRSFAYGNAKIENDRVTKEMIDQAASKE